MSTTRLILVLACITTVWAQAGLPSCARPCFAAIAPKIGCQPEDTQCLCRNPDFRNRTAECSLVGMADEPTRVPGCGNRVSLYLQVITALDNLCQVGTSSSSTQSNSTSQTSTTSQNSTSSSITSTTSSSSASSSSSSSTTPTTTSPPPLFSSTSTTVYIQVVTVVPTNVTSPGFTISPEIGFRGILSHLVGSWVASVILILI